MCGKSVFKLIYIGCWFRICYWWGCAKMCMWLRVCHFPVVAFLSLRMLRHFCSESNCCLCATQQALCLSPLFHPAGVYRTHCLFFIFFHFSGLLSFYLLLLCSLCQIHLTHGGNRNSPFIFSVTGDCLTAFILCQHVFGFVSTRVCVCVSSTHILSGHDQIFPGPSFSLAFLSNSQSLCICVWKRVCMHVCLCVFEAFICWLVEIVSVVFFPLIK